MEEFSLKESAENPDIQPANQRQGSPDAGALPCGPLSQADLENLASSYITPELADQLLPRRVDNTDGLEDSGSSPPGTRGQAGTSHPSNRQPGLLEAALRYASIGLKVFPCWPRTKKPMVSDGFLAATTDPEQIKRWWSGTKSEANIGLPMEMNGLICIDCDAKKGGPRDRVEFREMYGAYPDTTEQRSGSNPPGLHLIFRAPEGIDYPVDGEDIKPGIDVKYRGYIMLDPSVHPDSGNNYRLDGTDPLVNFAPLPDSLRWAIAPRVAPNDKKPGLGEMPAEIAEGSRNDTLYRYACKLRAMGASLDGIEALLLAENKNRCKPPLPDHEVRGIAASAAKYAPGTTAEQKQRARAAEPDPESGPEPGAWEEPPEQPESPAPDDSQAPPEPDLSDAVKASNSQVSRLINIARHGELFHAPTGIAYTRFKLNGCEQTHPVMSLIFEQYLTVTFSKLTGRHVAPDALKRAIKEIAAYARLEGPEEKIYLRTAGFDKEVYIDLGTKDWSVVHITADGWKIVPKGPYFRRSSGMHPLPIPVRGGSIAELRELINVKDDEAYALAVAFLVAALRGLGPFPVLIICGEAGSAKTSASRLVLNLIDPCEAGVRSPAKEEDDMATASRNAYALAYDNMSGISNDMADVICRFATDYGYSKRQLYTDLDEVSFSTCCPVILNGIDSLATRGDLVQRGLVMTLSPIRRYQTRRSLRAKEEEIMGRVFGALLDAVACSIRRQEEVDMEPYRGARMLDMAQTVVAACPALGWTGEWFMDLYHKNRAEGSRSVLESAPVARAIYMFVARHDGAWEGTLTKLLHGLDAYRPDDDKYWPTNVQALRNKLTRYEPDLRMAAGMEIEYKRSGHQGARIVRLMIVKDVGGYSADNADVPEMGRQHGSSAVDPIEKESTYGYEDFAADDADNPFPSVDPEFKKQEELGF